MSDAFAERTSDDKVVCFIGFSYPAGRPGGVGGAPKTPDLAAERIDPFKEALWSKCVGYLSSGGMTMYDYRDYDLNVGSWKKNITRYMKRADVFIPFVNRDYISDSHEWCALEIELARKRCADLSPSLSVRPFFDVDSSVLAGMALSDSERERLNFLLEHNSEAIAGYWKGSWNSTYDPEPWRKIIDYYDCTIRAIAAEKVPRSKPDPTSERADVNSIGPFQSRIDYLLQKWRATELDRAALSKHLSLPFTLVSDPDEGLDHIVEEFLTRFFAEEPDDVINAWLIDALEPYRA